MRSAVVWFSVPVAYARDGEGFEVSNPIDVVSIQFFCSMKISFNHLPKTFSGKQQNAYFLV